MNAQRFALGDTIDLHAAQTVYAPLRVQSLTIGLICDKTTKHKSGSMTTISTNPDHEQRVSPVQDHQARMGEHLEADQTFSIPPDGNPSSPASHKDYPRYAWRIELATRLDDSPDYRAKFPITVQATRPSV